MLNLDILTHFEDEYKKQLKPIISFINEDKNILKNKNVVNAIVTFNLALYLLDQEPKIEHLENHILYGDLYLSEFYIAMSELDDFDTLSDILDIAKEVINLKSLNKDNDKINELEERYILFGPILYLRDREYISTDIDPILDFIMQNGDFNDK